MNDTDLVPQPYFGERLRRLRQQRGLKQSDLADVGLSVSYVSRIESGSRAVTVQQAELLARRLGVDVRVFESSREVCLTRLLSPSVYGITGLIMSVFYMINMVSDIGLQAYVVRHHRSDEPHFLDSVFTIHAVRGV